MPTLIDGHLDLAWNAIFYDRDLTLPLTQLNAVEADMEDGRFRGRATVSLPELRQADCRIVIATLLARSGRQVTPSKAYRRVDLDYRTPLACHAAATAQLDWYRQMERLGEMTMLRSRAELDAHWDQCRRGGGESVGPVGMVLSMEGADPILGADELADWVSAGLRLIGPAHYGFSRYAAGTGVDGPLTDAGRELLAAMGRLGVGLDVTHLSDSSMAEALERFDGPVLASHHNCRTLVPGDRQLTDGQIEQLVGRDAVIGMALDAWMLYPGWVRGQTLPEVVGLEAVVDHVDHICQLAGSARHVAIGSDLDGGFGHEQTPRDVRAISDLQRLSGKLADRGYSDADIDGIYHGNWLRFLRRLLT
ncbi:MAG: membrane dipeptidase [Pirellulales bacterium]